MPGEARNWTGRAVTWTQIHREAKAEKVEYFATAIGRVFGQRRRAYKLARTLEFYKGWDITLVGHSNGCDVIVDALRDYPARIPKLNQVHLLSAACEADFYKNGLNVAILKRWVDRVFVYLAGQDVWLRLAHSHLGALLGYGTLGLHGPLNVALDCEDHIKVLTEPDYGHSDWWTRANFERTMTAICDV